MTKYRLQRISRNKASRFGGLRAVLDVYPGQPNGRSFFRRWDNKGWYYYDPSERQYFEDPSERQYFPTLKAAIAMWRLMR